ncbi:hypothetical protein [Morganella morganii]|uniref:hypothetical protein n=1 Tax=Morganella morganii TaxID=582 RepID=UPI000F8326E8|nr:hypothetical protein [Morganella morganii]RTY31585.1 hypothetical protein EKS33_08880 [Morganella morganii subsp. morganii]
MDSDQFIIATFRRMAILCGWHEKGFEHYSDEGASKDIGTIAAKANANLIAAAPELLEQLIRLRDIIANYLPEDDDHLDVVDAAINKALGRG